MLSENVFHTFSMSLEYLSEHYFQHYFLRTFNVIRVVNKPFIKLAFPSDKAFEASFIVITENVLDSFKYHQIICFKELLTQSINFKWGLNGEFQN